MIHISTSETRPLPSLKTQEIPFDDPASVWRFLPSENKPFLATPAAIEMYGAAIIWTCLMQLQSLARAMNGLDYLQVFEDITKTEALWFIEDGEGGAITALLPSDY